MVNNNTTYGISVWDNSLVLDNNCDYNGRGRSGPGILANGDFSRIEGNRCTRNDYGIYVGDWNLVVKNMATGNLLAQYLEAGANNKFGTITDDPTTAGPWDNFEYPLTAASSGKPTEVVLRKGAPHDRPRLVPASPTPAD